MHVMLMGMRGSGKTEVGRIAAPQLEMEFLDLDQAVLRHLNQPNVRQAWEVLGEAAWREAEVESLSRALRMPDRFLALGGGTPITPAAFRLIRQAQGARRALLIYLYATADEIVRRLTATPGDRPSLTGEGLLKEIGSVLARRDPIYRELADVVVHVTSLAPSMAAEEVVREVLARRE